MHTARVTVSGTELNYLDAGKGPAILCLHGLGGQSASWEPQLRALSERYRVIAWDMPGFGRSDLLPAGIESTRTYSNLAHGLLDALGIQEAVGFGTSYGTVILADLAANNPGRIKGMVFACGVTGSKHLDAATSEKMRATRRHDILSMGQRRFAEVRNATYVSASQPADVVSRVVELAGSATEEGYLQAYNSMMDADIFPSLAAIDVPALVISGANDPIAPAKDCERVAKALRNAAYHCLENCGHYVNLEQTARFNGLVDTFLARIGYAA